MRPTEYRIIAAYAKAYELRPQARLVGGDVVFLDRHNKEVRVTHNSMVQDLKRSLESGKGKRK
jgi:hypothetical protein